MTATVPAQRPKRDLIVSARIPRRLRLLVLQAAQRRAKSDGTKPNFNEAVNVALEEYVERSAL